MSAVLDACPLLEFLAVDPDAQSAVRSVTRFEARGLRLGHRVHELAYRRRG
jgi:hypothetical protein